MEQQIINCTQAKQTDLVEYLQSLNIHPSSNKGNDYWYNSPLHNERTPSFKVNRKLNLWYDHSIGKGGNLIDFGVLYFNCSVAEFLERINQSPLSFSFHQQNYLHKDSSERDTCKIKLVEVKNITDSRLGKYLEERAIPGELANRYCKEIRFEVNQKQHACIGFKNNEGGYELCNTYYKGTIAPKDVTFINEGNNLLTVFEGFIDFLSFMVEKEKLLPASSNYLILNSLAFFEKSKTTIENHDSIYLFLDNDEAGKNMTAKAMALSSRYIDKSNIYSHCKDLNDWLVKEKKFHQRQHTKIRMRF